mmetsp:Transcript_26878/g.53813  ORF Transcript_26878/g.53813 Transcript_26878/m.53813 type:complete len:959 (-) Transcript_26878:135-3011(-)
MIRTAFILGLLSCVSFVLSEVTVLKQVQTIYDKSPKLRIRGSGFDVEDHDITLDIGSQGQPSLVAGKDFLITTDGDGDGLILKLITNKKWVDLSNRTPPVALVLNSVKFKSNGDDNLLIEPIIVAQVLATPTVNENDLVLYQTASNELRINGTGFIGAKKVDLYFDPPLTKEVAYEDVSPYPLTKNQVVLRLRHGYEWREDVGPLRVLGVDTGGGPVKVNGDEGVEVGDVELDRDEHNVSVEDTADTQLVYTDDPYVFVHGSNFNEVGNLLRFANGILGNDVNYTTITQSTSTLKLHLSANSHWRKNMDNLPGTLTLLAVNAGGGYVAVGPLNSGKGRDIATVFERPNVYSNNARIYRTHSHELHVQGTGFPSLVSGFKPQLRFSPVLTEGLDYTLRVVSRLEMELTLVDGMAWRSDAGPLMVTHINTRGDTGGWEALPGNGVHIAEVVDDVAAEETGGVEIFPMGTKVYQSAKQETITVTGSGFKEDMSLILDPPLVAGTDYTLRVMSEHQLVLKLSSGKKWRADEGLLIAKKVKIGGKEYALAGKDGIRVAVVLADPVITPSETNYHESQSKLIIIEGSGFTTVTDTTILLRPTTPASYKVLGVMDDAIRLQLQPGMDWLPAFSSIKGDDTKIELSVSSIDTGAGMITFAEPIKIGNIIKDREGVTCDDSCEFAFDGVCDDGSDPIDEYYYQNYFNYMDDDLGGFYYEYEEGEYDDFRRRRLSPSAKKVAVTQQKRRRTQAFDDFDDEVPYGGGYYDDYYMENEDYAVSACVEGTDCTDCGGVDAIIDYSQPLHPESGYESCTNTCIYPRDGVCDDPRGTKYCELGTDCQDCGPVGADNFTRSDDDGWWDDDDDYWTFNDGNFLDQTKGLEANRHKVKVYKREEVGSPAAMFLVVLEGMVYTVGAIFAAAALYLLNRWYKGQSVPFMNAFSPEMNQTESSSRAPQRMPITPDEFRT